MASIFYRGLGNFRGFFSLRAVPAKEATEPKFHNRLIYKRYPPAAHSKSTDVSTGDECMCPYHGRMDMPDQPNRKRSFPALPDPLKHFSRDKPGWKLAALFVCKVPLILGSLAMLVKALKAWF